MKKIACLMVSIMSLGAASLATASEVYKWTDEKGVVHYSEAPPPDSSGKATTLNIHAAPPDGPATPMAAAVSGPAASAKSEKSKANDEEKQAQRQQACDEWKSDLTSLGSHGRIRVMGDDGSASTLTEDEKQARIKADQDSIDKYCNGN